MSAIHTSPLTSSTASPRGQLNPPISAKPRSPQAPSRSPVSASKRTKRWLTVSTASSSPPSTAMPWTWLNTASDCSGGTNAPMDEAGTQPSAVRSKRSSRAPHRSAPHTSPSGATATRRRAVNVPGVPYGPVVPRVARWAPALVNTWTRLLLESATKTRSCAVTGSTLTVTP